MFPPNMGMPPPMPNNVNPNDLKQKMDHLANMDDNQMDYMVNMMK